MDSPRALPEFGPIGYPTDVVPSTRVIQRTHFARALSVLCPLLLAAVAIMTFMTAPRDEDFWWTDGASFALNGELVRDYLASGLGQSPMAFASEWFLHYPALTISLYPPIFPLAEAVVFAIFGFSHPAAQATVTIFAGLAAYGLYRTSRTAVGVIPASAAAVMLFATPEVLLWSRQIVMEIPALSCLLLAAAALLRYQAAGGTKKLFAAVLLALAAVYTKQTALFVVPAFAVALLADGGFSLLWRKSTWIAFAAGVVGLIPLAVFTVLYASENFHIALGSGTGEDYGRLSFQALAAYGRVLPEIIGVIPLLGSVAYLGLVRLKGWRGSDERRLAVLMLAWFVVDYLFISVTADFETRYATFLTVPPVVLSVLLITRVIRSSWSGTIALAMSACLFAIMIFTHPVTRLTGYAAVAQYMLEHTGQNDVVLFHGKDSKNFTFSIRARSPVAKLFILRAEKFLVDYNIMREWGITDRNLSVDEVNAIIDRYGISYIVFQPDFWTDQPSIAALQQLAYSDRFSVVAEFPITSEEPNQRKTMRVYRNERPTSPTDGHIRMNLAPVGGTISGRL